MNTIDQKSASFSLTRFKAYFYRCLSQGRKGFLATLGVFTGVLVFQGISCCRWFGHNGEVLSLIHI